MASTDFNGLMEEWKRWAKAAERTNEGWQSDFPKWDLLIAAAIEALCGPMPDEDTLFMKQQLLPVHGANGSSASD